MYVKGGLKVRESGVNNNTKSLRLDLTVNQSP